MIKYAVIGVFALVVFLVRELLPFITRATTASQPAWLLLLGIGLLTLDIVARRNLPLV